MLVIFLAREHLVLMLILLEFWEIHFFSKRSWNFFQDCSSFVRKLMSGANIRRKRLFLLPVFQYLSCSIFLSLKSRIKQEGAQKWTFWLYLSLRFYSKVLKNLTIAYSAISLTSWRGANTVWKGNCTTSIGSLSMAADCSGCPCICLSCWCIPCASPRGFGDWHKNGGQNWPWFCPPIPEETLGQRRGRVGSDLWCVSCMVTN